VYELSYAYLEKDGGFFSFKKNCFPRESEHWYKLRWEGTEEGKEIPLGIFLRIKKSIKKEN